MPGRRRQRRRRASTRWSTARPACWSTPPTTSRSPAPRPSCCATASRAGRWARPARAAPRSFAWPLIAAQVEALLLEVGRARRRAGPMRVLYVNHTGRGQRRRALAAGSARRPARRQVEPTVACPAGALAEQAGRAGRRPRADPRHRRQPPAAPAAHQPWRWSRSARSALQVRRLAPRTRADLVHANTIRAALLALLAPALRPTAGRRPRPRLPARRGASRASSCGVARRRRRDRRQLRLHARPVRRPAPRRAGRVVHNPVDLERFDPGAVDGTPCARELGPRRAAPVLAVSPS